MMVYLTWHHLVFDRFETISADISVIEQDRLEKQLNQCAATFLARWISVSPMSPRLKLWGDVAAESFQRFATELTLISGKLDMVSPATMIGFVDQTIDQILALVARVA
jgi:hypothetical protein